MRFIWTGIVYSFQNTIHNVWKKSTSGPKFVSGLIPNASAGILTSYSIAPDAKSSVENCGTP